VAHEHGNAQPALVVCDGVVRAVMAEHEPEAALVACQRGCGHQLVEVVPLVQPDPSDIVSIPRIEEVLACSSRECLSEKGRLATMGYLIGLAFSP
jgi:hypothetical protein